MEELQDAIEDAQYVNAIATQEDGPKPVLSWEVPTEEQLAKWDAKIRKEALPDGPYPFTLDWCLQSAIGFFLFSAFLKDNYNDYARINFVEDVQRWKKLRGAKRVEKAKAISKSYLEPLGINEVTGTKEKPMKIEIDEWDLKKEVTNLYMTTDEFQALYSSTIDESEDKINAIGLKGAVVDEIISIVKSCTVDKSHRTSRHMSTDSQSDREEKRRSMQLLRQSWNDAHLTNWGLSESLFGKAETIIVENLKRQYWRSFLASENYSKMRNFLWFQDRPVTPDDFFTMRVLGRGGFGSVIACRKGTSGKLYAMKVMNKKRIKLKKSEQLTLSERKALAAVESPFVVNLKYSFHSNDDVFFILDLMTGGDLGYHLHQKGKFPKKECQYYAARIMLGLQALHDKGYVYRDLKPENCLLADDGRVKITDLGLTTKITPTLHGAAGTRGYWAPEMLRRDKKGRRMSYGHTVDWFSFGCCVAEFISGANPFRSEAALNFGLAAGKDSKEKAIDHATLEMYPEFPDTLFDKDAADLCKSLLEKDEKVRLGTDGCEEIMAHPWFKNANWESIMSDRKRPPYVPPKDVNAASQSEIGTFVEDKKYQECVLDEKDEKYYRDWEWTNPNAYAAEVIEFLIYERETGEPLLPISQNTGCCCAIM